MHFCSSESHESRIFGISALKTIVLKNKTKLFFDLQLVNSIISKRKVLILQNSSNDTNLMSLRYLHVTDILLTRARPGGTYVPPIGVSQIAEKHTCSFILCASCVKILAPGHIRSGLQVTLTRDLMRGGGPKGPPVGFSPITQIRLGIAL